MSNTIENYGVKDIKTLEGIEAIRLRPGAWKENSMKYLIGILFIGLILFAIGGIVYFFVLEDIQTKNHIKWLEKLDEINKE